MGKKKRKNGLVEKFGARESNGAFDEDVAVGYKNQTMNEITRSTTNDLYFGNDFFKRIVNELPEDSMKKGFILKFSPNNEVLSTKIQNEFNFLELDNYLIEFLQMGRKDGFSALLPILKTKVLTSTDEVLELENIAEIRDFNIIKRDDVSRIERYTDITQENYGQIEFVYIKNKNGIEIKYHRSWLLIFETGITTSNPYQNKLHESIFSGLYDALQVNYNVSWSIGQYAFASYLKYIKIGDQKVLDKIRDEKSRDAYKAKKENEINTSSTLFFGKDDEIGALNLSGGTNFESLQKASFNDIATRVGIPVSKLMGASSGALASAKEDVNRYIEIVEKFQNVTVKDFIRRLIKMILSAKNINQKDFDIEFNSIRTKEKTDEKIEAETEKIKAETKKINIEALIALNKELNDENIANVLKQIAQGLKEELLGEIE